MMIKNNNCLGQEIQWVDLWELADYHRALKILHFLPAEDLKDRYNNLITVLTFTKMPYTQAEGAVYEKRDFLTCYFCLF